MAGVGFALQALSKRETLSAGFAAFAISAIIAVGPWLFTVICVAGINMATVTNSGLTALAEMRIVIIYNFSISLVLSGPIAVVTTRFLADGLYARDMSRAPGALFTALGLTLATQAPVAIYLYSQVATLSAQMQMIAIASYLIVACLWVVAVFLSALKDYVTVTVAFASGLLLSFALSLGLSNFGPEGLLGGFSAGLAFTLFVLLARVLAEYPTPASHMNSLLGYFRLYPEIALSGLIYNAGIWVDKWIMWTAPQAVSPASGLVSYPAYDGAMFAAQLTMVPAIALFVYTVETKFFAAYRTFYRTIELHGTLAKINSAHREIIGTLSRAAASLGALQVTLALFVIALSPKFLVLLDLHATQLGMFRLGVLGSAFHAIFLFLTIVLAYFDLRRSVLLVQIIFFVMNGAATAATLALGPAWYGYGYFLASVVTASAAALIAASAVGRLPYLTFIANNPAVRTR
ncbi:MAG: exopolysaccharide Pel transporter PelG [Micropepsaceae bacterium]